MNESFLHYVWQFQYFDKNNLRTAEGEELTIFKTGSYNTDAGPDFLQAKIKIAQLEWAGSIEIHIKSSDWLAHQHTGNGAYENVILHVVWENNQSILRKDGTAIPTLELKHRVSKELWSKYAKLVNSSMNIACQSSFSDVASITKLSMLEQAMMRRFVSKSSEVKNLLNENQGDWEETTYQWLARCFGFKINSEPLFLLAKALPYKIIRKHSNNLLQIEALLFGQAGMLETKTKHEYITALFKEYQFLSSKYSLAGSKLNPAQWKFLRLRPANFPTLRIAQLANLLQSQSGLFSQIIEGTQEEWKNLLETNPSDYWQTHYHFAKPSKRQEHALGEESKLVLMINAVIPILVAYGKQTDNDMLVEKAANWLQALPAEKNKIISYWNSLGLQAESAFDSQALIEQYNHYCSNRQCLNCAVGTSLIKP
ncbi:MAG: DUF2851 family protein [Flammeovirgaceae bacterium]|nr:DUF2851 family protein [Flammeovirgaceae bacterium]